METPKHAVPALRYQACAPRRRSSQESVVRVRGGPSTEGSKRAVLVAHGMGQQQPFDTLVSVAEGLLSEARRNGSLPEPGPSPRAVRTQLGKEQLARYELSLEANSANEVHVYEAYWAPLTEGRVRLRDVMGFLRKAGWNGVRNAPGGRFRRWVLGELRGYAIPFSHVVHLWLALVTVFSLMCINTAIALAVAAHLSESIGPLVSVGRALPLVWGLFHVEVAVALLFIASLFVGTSLVQRLLFYALLLCTFVAGIGALLLLGAGLVASDEFFAHPAFEGLQIAGWTTAARVGTGALLLLVSATARWVIVQYVGDVAAYISSHTLDRFDEIRSAIRARVADTVRAIYDARNEDGSFLYDSISIVGHSLGSVISYDALNRLLNDDALCSDSAQLLHVRERTNLLLTFGSPLDKTAYVFGKRDRGFVLSARSALAATSQPLILSEEFRNIPWINVYSPLDIVSGELNLYDIPGTSGKPQPWAPGRVKNVEDQGVKTYLKAHVEYWDGVEVWQQLFPYLRGVSARQIGQADEGHGHDKVG